VRPARHMCHCLVPSRTPGSRLNIVRGACCGNGWVRSSHMSVAFNRQGLDRDAAQRAQSFPPRRAVPAAEHGSSRFHELFTKIAEDLAAMTKSPDFDLAYRQYVDLLIRCVANTIYKDPPLTTWGDREFDREKRATGRDWPSRTHTMAGVARWRNLADLVRRALDERIPGDFIETGVWRGGACIFVRGLLAACGDPSRRVFVADSFAGLPSPNRDLYPFDNGMTLHLVRN
jgi:hypothetical protein